MKVTTKGWAVDLGNCNSGVAYWDALQDEPRLVELPAICRKPGSQEPLEAPRMIPSAVHVLDDGGFWADLGRLPLLRRFLIGQRALIGRQALERNTARIHPAFVEAFKPYLQREARRVLARTAQRGYTARELAQLYVRELLTEIRRSSGERVRQLVFTTPVEAYEAYRAELTRIGRNLGLRRVRFLDEPVAAALGYGLSLASERRVLVVDFGAGTFNMALVALSARDAVRGGARVIAKTGRPVGGHHVSLWLLELICEQAGFALVEAPGDDDTHFWRRLMLAEATCVKERLFFEPRTGVRLVPPAYLREPAAGGPEPWRLEVTREVLIELLERRGVYKMIDRALEEVLEQAAGQGLGEGDIEEVLMVGGSTLLPEVYPRMERRFGRDRVRAWQPFEAVALGAAAFAAERVQPADFIVHDYAFITYEARGNEPRYNVIVPRGTRFPTAPDFWKRQLVPTCALGEPERMFKLVVCEIGRPGSAERFVWDARGELHALGTGDGQPVIVELNKDNPTLGYLDPPHPPSERGPRVEVAFGVNADRWLTATVFDLKTRRHVLREAPVVRLL